MDSEVQTWRDLFNCRAHVEYFYRYVSLCSSPNGVFAAKLMWTQLISLSNDIVRYLGVRGNSHHDILSSYVGQLSYIRLVRRDRLRQAISLVRAMQTGIWSQKIGDAIRTVPSVYDKAAIDWAIRKIRIENLYWARHVRLAGGVPLTLYYEDFCKQPTGASDTIVSWLGLESLPADSGGFSLTRQADGTTEEWVQRYLRG